MTRINVVPVEELTRQHLIAEYRELPRVFTLVQKHVAKGHGRPATLPESYRLGCGHLLFFYDKLGFLAHRHTYLIAEMQRRGYKPTMTELLYTQYASLPAWCWGGYAPTLDALAINRARIAKRLAGDKSP